MPLIRAIAFAVLALLMPFTAAVAQQCPAVERVTKFGRWFTPALEITAGARRQEATGGDLPYDYPRVAVRLLIEAAPTAGASWKLMLRDPKMRVLAILEPSDFTGGAPGAAQRRWTGRLDAAQVMVELIGGDAGTLIRIVEGVALPAGGDGYQVYSTRVPGNPDWKPLGQAEAELYLARGESVGMLATGGQSVGDAGELRHESWCCSGAMLTSDIYITNWHCGGTEAVPEATYWTASGACDNAVIDLGWDEGTPARRMYGCAAVLRTNKRLDYALLRVRPIVGPGAAVGRANPVRISETMPVNDAIFLIHHAECRPKWVSFNGCAIKQRTRRAWTDPANATTGPDIAYDCDTETGASGAPVFDGAGRMIALHHLGYERQRQGGQCTAPDRLNKGVSMHAIMDDLRATVPAIAAEIAGG